MAFARWGGGSASFQSEMDATVWKLLFPKKKKKVIRFYFFLTAAVVCFAPFIFLSFAAVPQLFCCSLVLLGKGFIFGYPSKKEKTIRGLLGIMQSLFLTVLQEKNALLFVM